MEQGRHGLKRESVGRLTAAKPLAWHRANPGSEHRAIPATARPSARQAGGDLVKLTKRETGRTRHELQSVTRPFWLPRHSLVPVLT